MEETVTVFHELYSKTAVLHPADTTLTKTYKTKTFSPFFVNIVKSDDLEECPSNKTIDDSSENVEHEASNEIILEKIPKIETAEQNLWSDSESNDVPDRDPFADIECDPSFVHCRSRNSDQTVHQQEAEKCTQTNLPTSCRSTNSKHTLPTPTPPTTIVQNKSQSKFDCKLCFTKLGSQNDLKSHLRLCSTTHKNGRLFCVNCNIIYGSTFSFRNHNLKVHRRGIKPIRPDHYRIQLKCQFCPLMFVIQNNFKIHTESHVKNLELDTATTAQNEANLELKLNPYKCQECGSTFSTVIHLSNHVLAKHVDHIFKCPHENCEKIFNTKGNLRQHFNTHSDYRPFKCPEPNCGKRFKSKQHMSEHVTCHSKTKLFICFKLNCGKTFRTESDLAKHAEFHKNDDNDRPVIKKPFACPECQLTFSQNWRVTTHVNIVHRKKELLPCPHADCGKTFKHESSLSVHVKDKHGHRGKEESFKCSQPGCNFTSKQKCYVKVHMRTHTGERPFKCTVVDGCSKTFIKHSHLKRHIRQKHMENI